MNKFRLLLALCAVLILLVGCGGGADGASTTGSPTQKIKIGFLVKTGTEVWFQKEWEFAKEAAKDLGFEVVTIETTNGDQVLSAIDNLATQGAQGFIICTPDTKLGPAIVAKAKEKNLKLFSVDDRFISEDRPMTDVHYLGISAYEIGKMVGQAIVDEMKVRGWKPEDVGAVALTIEELETAMLRVNGAIEVLLANGFLEANIFRTPWKVHDIPGANDAANITLTQHSNVKKWVSFASNDDGVLGMVRATETHGIPAENVIGVGINGTSAKDDFMKEKMTGMFASVLLSPRRHGYDTAEMMYRWIKENKEPAKETFTSGILINRTNFKEEMTKAGLL